MTIQECYELLHGDYAEAKTRLMTDKLVDKFMLKFLSDPTMNDLENAVADADIEKSFRAAHTLKGVAANLAFTELREKASDLTEQLRACTSPADSELLKNVRESYSLVTDTIKRYEEEKQ